MPDSVAYVCAISTTKHEFFFMEVKTTDQACNKFQRDLIKLGKAMQIALDKLILNGVDSPEVVGLLVEAGHAPAYKIDLKLNGQYRLIQLGEIRFHEEWG